jgi:SAM-dependent methyltransferase
MLTNNPIENDVRDFFSKKVKEHGATPLGAVWNNKERQEISFQQLIKIIEPLEENFSINDVGCGYGELFKFLSKKYKSFDYYGVDISSEMIKQAKSYCKGAPHLKCSFFESNTPIQACDYSMASGIFNMKLSASNEEWIDYVKSSIISLDNFSTKGFTLNFLTSYSDKDKMVDNLFYANPCEFFDFCKQNFSENVSLLHDYGCYEFTILVRKNYEKK